MAKFAVGDKVRMPGVPYVVEVLEVAACDDPGCDLGGEIFRFADPGGQVDWEHTSMFEQVGAD